jgi:hypothetical protein
LWIAHGEHSNGLTYARGRICSQSAPQLGKILVYVWVSDVGSVTPPLLHNGITQRTLDLR